jgi:hypothetical protein
MGHTNLEVMQMMVMRRRGRWMFIQQSAKRPKEKVRRRRENFRSVVALMMMRRVSLEVHLDLTIVSCQLTSDGDELYMLLYIILSVDPPCCCWRHRPRPHC